MKKLLVCLVGVLVSVAMSAQTYVGGGLGFSSVDNKSIDGKVTTVTISPELGYKLSDKWSIGAKFDFEYAQTDDTDVTGFDIAPYARYNFLKVGAVTFFADATVEIGGLKVKDGDNMSAWAAGIEPGIIYDVNNKISLVARAGMLGYFDTEDIDGQKGFKFDLNTMNLQFGMYWNF